jgi:hypothetical protein
LRKLTFLFVCLITTYHTRRPFGDVVACPHDDHYYGPCGTIPEGAQFGSEFGWPSPDIYTITAAITPKGEGSLRPTTGGSPFLDFRSTIKNPDWTVDAML